METNDMNDERTNADILADLADTVGDTDPIYEAIESRLSSPEPVEPEPLKPSRATENDMGDCRIGIADDKQAMLNRQQLADEESLLNAIVDGDDEGISKYARHNVRRHNLQGY